MKLKTLTASSILALAVLAGANLASAQQQGPGGAMMGPGMMMRGGQMGPGMGMAGGCPMTGMMMGMMMDEAAMPSFTEGRIAFLKAELAITDVQNAVWDAYAEALKKNLQGMQGMRQTMITMWQAKSPVERLDAHISVMEGRLKALKEVKPALVALHAALSEEQKKKAEALLTGMGCMM